MDDSNGNLFGNDKERGNTGIFSCKDFQSVPYLESGNQDIYEAGFDQSCYESGPKRIRLSPELNNLQRTDFNSSMQSRPLGLELTKSQSLLNLVHKRLSKGKQSDFSTHENQGSYHVHRPKTKNDGLGSQEKLKASNFPAIFIKIGSWQRICRHEGELVAKIYYAKQKMVWEVLEGALKSKIEIQWSDIAAIRAIMPDNQQGILEIELNHPPLFYRETNPQPRKHTLWQQGSDFTGGQATIYRRHFVVFHHGILDRHYEKLLQCDERLFALNQKPFPSQECPFFDPSMYRFSEFSLSFNGYGSGFHSYQTFPETARETLLRSIPNSTVMNWPRRNERGRNCQFETHSPQLWNQGLNFPKENVKFEGPLEITSATQDNQIFNSQNYQSNSNAEILNEIENHLLGDTQVAWSDETTLLAKVESMMHSHLDPTDVNSNENNPMHTQINDQITDTDQVVQNAAEIDAILDCVLLENMVQWLVEPQDSREGTVMETLENNSLTPFVFTGSTSGDFSTLDSNIGN